MKKLREEKGITLIALTITIMVLMILAITVNTSLKSTTELSNFNEVKVDVLLLTQEVKLYYLKNGILPVDRTAKYDVTTVGGTYFIPEQDRNPNDLGNYYAIDKNVLNVSLNKGSGYEKDVYIVNEESLTVYYLGGVTLEGEKYYTMQDTFKSGSHTTEFYSKAELPIISVVTMENLSEKSNFVKKDDKIQINILTNYELTRTPTLKVLGNTVPITWDGKRGTAIYTISGSEAGFINDSKITFEISDYAADGREGTVISEVTFGNGLYCNVTP